MKVLKPTGAPVNVYDVFKDGEQDRSDIASVVLEPDTRQVEDVGHDAASLKVRWRKHISTHYAEIREEGQRTHTSTSAASAVTGGGSTIRNSRS